VPSLQDSFLDVGIHLCFGVNAVPVGKVLFFVMHSRNLLTPLDTTDALSYNTLGLPSAGVRFFLPFTEQGIQVLKMFINPLFFPMLFRNILQ